MVKNTQKHAIFHISVDKDSDFKFLICLVTFLN